MRAPFQIVRQAAVAWLDTPPAAGRAWVPDCRARTFIQSVGPFYDESRSQGSPGRDQFVISISSHVYIPLTGTRPANAGPAVRAPQATQKIFGSAEQYGETSVHDQGIYVVIRLHGFLVAIQWLCGAKFADKLPYRTEPAYPPRAGPCAAPALPPGGGRLISLFGWLSATLPRGRSICPGGDPPEPPIRLPRVTPPWSARPQAGRLRRPWTGGCCRCRIWGTGCSSGSPLRRGRT